MKLPGLHVVRFTHVMKDDGSRGVSLYGSARERLNVGFGGTIGGTLVPTFRTTFYFHETMKWSRLAMGLFGLGHLGVIERERNSKVCSKR